MEFQSTKTRSFLQRHGMLPDEMPLPNAVELFVEDMDRGLSGQGGSMDMIPTYLSCGAPPVGQRAAVIDAGGTNFRASQVLFTENGPVIERVERTKMPGVSRPATWEQFMDFSARELAPMLDGASGIGFCFSFRAEVTPERDGKVIMMSKGVELSGYEGRLVCADLLKALERAGLPQPPAALVNDTAAVLLSGADLLRSGSYDSLIGLVCGTGQNSCCVVDRSKIGKLSLEPGPGMLVNLESGCFDGFVRGDYDLELDEHSTNPGDHIFEKMTSGAYLGQLCLLTLRGAAREGLLTNDAAGKFLLMNELTSDKADRYTSSIAAEREFRSRDALVISDICRAIFERAARCVCANLSAILILTGRGLDELRPACVCADGSVIRYSSTFQQELNYYMDSFTRAILGRHCVVRSAEDATTLGTAAAALLR